MGITYLFLGLSSLLDKEILMGIVQLCFAIIALAFLIISILPSNRFKLFYSVNENEIKAKNMLITSLKVFSKDEITKLEVDKTYLNIYIDEKVERIRLSALNYNELHFFMKGIKKFSELNKLKLKQSYE